ncbi:MAG: twin-arginine translocation signal domain-containing protein, partial [Thermoguttaceae bacterium]|nr:twin-arginine translocation signal domain-containing protein [Thermoguttaceae bacterium]
MSSRFSRRDFLKAGTTAAALSAVSVSVPAYC